MSARPVSAPAWLLLGASILVASCSAPTVGSEGLVESPVAPTPVPIDIPDQDPLQFPGYDVDRVTIAPLPSTAAPVDAPDTTAPALTGWAAFDDHLERSIIGGGSQAASVAVSIDGEIVHRATMGVRSAGTMAPVESQDRFRIASISKTITAITVLQLVEEGLIGIDQPVGEFLAAQLGVTAPSGGSPDITVRQLLTHRSGFAQYEDLFFRNQVGSCDEAATTGFTRSLQGAPGGGFRYSNMNYCVLGVLIERLTGLTYEEVVYQQLLTPLGISGMRLAPTFDPGPDEVEHPTAEGRNYMEVLGAAGAWIATPADLVTIIDSLDHSIPGWKPLEPATVDAMRTSANDPSNPDRGYGMGLILYGGGTIGHTGTVESTHSMVLDRSDGVTWAVTVSGDYPSATPRLAQIVDAALAAGGFVSG
jgi:D-alanyl-D-alanine carboxypeptidase